MNEEAKAEIDALRNGMVPGQSIEEIEATWDHYHLLEAYFERYYSDDKPIMASLLRLKSGLSQFTLDVRENRPSPYSGFSVELTALRTYLDGDYDDDGYPKRRR